MRLTVVLLVSALAFAACADGDDGDRTTTAMAGDTTTSTTVVGGSDLPGGDLVACESPAGFVISAPADWETNSGDVVPVCTQFDPEPFEVPRGSDARVAAVAAYVDPVSFSVASKPDDTREEDRAVTAVSGRQAVRIAYETAGKGLYPEGTPITTYLVDMTTTTGDERTLFVNTIGLQSFDYPTNRVVLDRMAATLEILDGSVETDPQEIADYRGGGGGFTVVAAQAGEQVCLSIPPEGEPVCTERPAADQVHTIRLRDVKPQEAGVTGERVWRVDMVSQDGSRYSYLPAGVPGTDLGAYAFHDSTGGFERLILRNVIGEQIREVVPGAA